MEDVTKWNEPAQCTWCRDWFDALPKRIGGRIGGHSKHFRTCPKDECRVRAAINSAANKTWAGYACDDGHRKPHGPWTWINFMAEYDAAGKRCRKCRKVLLLELRGTNHPDALVFDHILPRALGGLSTADNVQAMCWKCNDEKRAKRADSLQQCAFGFASPDTYSAAAWLRVLEPQVLQLVTMAEERGWNDFTMRVLLDTQADDKGWLVEESREAICVHVSMLRACRFIA